MCVSPKACVFVSIYKKGEQGDEEGRDEGEVTEQAEMQQKTLKTYTSVTTF